MQVETKDSNIMKLMHYFITSQENLTPSAIEIAQMQRVHYW